MMRVSKNRVGIAAAVALLISFLCGIVVYRQFGFIYAIADDVIMRDIVSGAFTGTPDGHLVFVKFAMGWLLSRCYFLNASMDWYGFCMTGVIFLSLAAFLYRGYTENRSIIWKCGYTIVSLLVFINVALFHAAQFEWTLSAAITGVAALFLYVTQREEDQQEGLENAIIFLLLMLTFSIRSDIFIMILPSFAIIYLWKHTEWGKEHRFFVKLKNWGLPVSVFIGMAAILIIEQLAYSSPDWKEFGEFQTARSQIYDYDGVPEYTANPEFFENLGITESEVRNLRHYALYLVNGMDADLMTQLSMEAERQNDTGNGSRIHQVKEGIMLALEQFLNLEFAPLNVYAILLFLILIIYCVRKERKVLVPIGAMVVIQGILWLILGIAGRLPERVAFSMHFVNLAMMLALIYRFAFQNGSQETDRRAVIYKRCTVAVIGILLGITAVSEWKETKISNELKIEKDGNYQLFKEYCKKQEGNLYFIETFSAEPVGGAVVTTKGDYSINNCLTLGDWGSTSPIDEVRMEKLGITSVEEEILNGESAYIVVRDAENPGFIGDYFAAKYEGCQMSMVEVVTIEDRNYYLYQVRVDK